MKYVLRIISFVICLVLLCLAAIEFTPRLGADVAWLSAAMLALGFCLSCLPFFTRYIKPKEEEAAETWAGTLGVDMFGMSFYFVAVIIAIIACNINAPEQQVAFRYQLCIHLLLIMMFTAFISWRYVVADKVTEVYHKEQVRLDGKRTIKDSLLDLENAVALEPAVPQEVKQRISTLLGNARFITPNPSQRAVALEAKVAEMAEAVRDAVSAGYAMNAESIGRYLDVLELAMKNRKNLLE